MLQSCELMKKSELQFYIKEDQKKSHILTL